MNVQSSISRKRSRQPDNDIKSNQKKRIKNQRLIDFVISSFSKELVLKVFSYLSSKDLIQCAIVSQAWSRLSNDEMLWKPLFFKRFKESLTLESLKSHHFGSQQPRRPSVTRYGGSWKTKYKIHHNWQLGNCHINDIVNPFSDTNNSSQEDAQYQLQFLHDTIFTVQPNSSVIDIWKYNNQESDESSIVLDCQLQSADSAQQQSSIHIVLLKLIETNTTEKCYLIAGYSNGGFVLWELISEHNKVNGQSTVQITEMAGYTPKHLHRENDNVIAISMAYPIIIICTESMRLYAFHINHNSNAAAHRLDLIHCLKSSITSSSVVIEIRKQKLKVSNNSTSQIKVLWKAVVCYGYSDYTSSVGVQELIFSSEAIVSSIFGRVEQSPSEFSTPFSYPLTSNQPPSTAETLTAMSFSPPHLFVAYANNTIKRYFVKMNNNCNSIHVSFVQTLYGHTFRVDALAVDASKMKLVSGDRSGIKIWDLSASSECQITLPHYKEQSNMNELPPLKIEMLGFDEDKIIAVVKSCVAEKHKMTSSFLRLWSFNSVH